MVDESEKIPLTGLVWKTKTQVNTSDLNGGDDRVIW